MIRVLIAALFLWIPCAFAVEIHVPAGWSHVAPPKDLPSFAKRSIGVTSGEKQAGVVISEMEPGLSLDEAVKGYVRTMPARGVNIQSNLPAVLNAHEGRHVSGFLAMSTNPLKIPVEVYFLVTDQTVLAIEVTSSDASSLIKEVLGWVALQPAALPSKADRNQGSTGPSLMEYLGMATVFGALGYAIFQSISKRRKSRSH